MSEVTTRLQETKTAIQSVTETFTALLASLIQQLRDSADDEAAILQLADDLEGTVEIDNSSPAPVEP
jgi:hypothetical protein